MSPDLAVRAATPDEFVAVLSVLEGALLDVDAGETRAAVEDGHALVAVDGDRVVGALVASPAGGEASAGTDARTCDATGEREPTEGSAARTDRRGGAHVEAVAVRAARRRRGIGRALVEAAAARYGTLTATCRPAVRPFYERLGFEVDPTDDGRWRAVRRE